MKRYIKNILAQNSSGEIMYICGKCGIEVDKEATVCPKCHSRLGKIKCPFCNFVGELEDFKEDTCPRCGRKKIKKDKDNKNINVNKAFRSHTKKDFLKRFFWLLFFSLLGILLLLIFFTLYYYNIL